MTNSKIIYYAPTSSMGETSDIDASKYRKWAYCELKKHFPGFDIEVSNRENTNSFWTNVNNIQIRDRIEFVIKCLWDECPWDF